MKIKIGDRLKAVFNDFETYYGIVERIGLVNGLGRDTSLWAEWTTNKEEVKNTINGPADDKRVDKMLTHIYHDENTISYIDREWDNDKN